MISRENILKIESRRKIYQFISKNPGFHVSALSKIINIPKSTIYHHLIFLKKHGFLEVKSENGYSRYYAAKKVSKIDKKLLDLFRQDTPRTIILLLLFPQGFSQSQMIKFAKYWKNHPSKIGTYLNKHQTTVSYYFQKLVELDLIETFKIGNETRYRLKNPEIILDLIITHKESVIDEASHRIITHIVNPNKKYIDSAFESYMKLFYEIFPHPYHV